MGEWHEKGLEKVKEPKKGGPEPWKLAQEAEGNVITPYHGLFNISCRPPNPDSPTSPAPQRNAGQGWKEK
jgi:hypothetical protein